MADGPLFENADKLARAFVHALRDMGGSEYHVDEGSRRLRAASRPFSLFVSIRFSGRLAGEYGLCLRPETAALLCGCWSREQGPAALAAARDESEGFVMEVLNAAVGEAILVLDKTRGGLRFEPASVSTAPADAAGTCAEVTALGEHGPVACSFVLYY